jgi:hypothetical protein
MTRPGRSWGEPLAPDATLVEVAGRDGDLAAAALGRRDAVLVFLPDPTSDFARAVGLVPGRAGTGDTVVACDLMDLGHGRGAVNMVVSGTPPDRQRVWHRLRPVVVAVDGRIVADEPALTVVVANGQFLRGADLVPRGHPGDGRLEVQVYALRPRERAGMRRRLAAGNHVPHPRIVQAAGRRVEIRWAQGERGLEVDGRPGASVGALSVEVLPGAARLLV